ncbi:MAG: hypothetical protein M1829_003474 [Trizodia sp. TS-e1964]|nr:MAG: hypothetical protein M1829_003474 [Trizodia sp. TS-e1964]
MALRKSNRLRDRGPEYGLLPDPRRRRQHGRRSPSLSPHPPQPARCFTRLGALTGPRPRYLSFSRRMRATGPNFRKTPPPPLAPAPPSPQRILSPRSGSGSSSTAPTSSPLVELVPPSPDTSAAAYTPLVQELSPTEPAGPIIRPNSPTLWSASVSVSSDHELTPSYRRLPPASSSASPAAAPWLTPGRFAGAPALHQLSGRGREAGPPYRSAAAPGSPRNEEAEALKLLAVSDRLMANKRLGQALKIAGRGAHWESRGAVGSPQGGFGEVEAGNSVKGKRNMYRPTPTTLQPNVSKI